MKRALALLVATLAGACASAPRPAATAASSGAPAPSFDAHESEILRDLAAVDRRIAKRARVSPTEDDLRHVTMGAVLREDASVVVIDGAVDVFSFDARARGLERAASKIASLPAESRSGERELLSRLVAEEQMRLEEERALPHSASALVRAIVDTWAPPKDAREAAEIDRWVARRLAELREVLSANALDLVRARDLDDSLDALEHIVSSPGYTTAMQELSHLRDTLEAPGSRPAAKTPSDSKALERRLSAHLGLTGTADDLRKRLVDAEVDLGKRARDAIAAAGLTNDVLVTSLEKHVLVVGPCLDAVPGSLVRSMEAPPERTPSCHLRHLVADVDDAASNALALAFMHDHVVVALWALDVATGDATIAEAQGRRHLLVPLLPDARARYERVALARPLAAIGAGETARLLALGDPRATARAWSSIGDVPLDVASRELTKR